MTIEQLDRVCERWRDATTPRQQTISGAFPKGYFESDQLIEQRYLAVYQLPLLAHELRKAMRRENQAVSVTPLPPESMP